MVDWSDIDERITKCNKILDENPGSQIFAALADAYRKRGDLDKAFRVCQNGLKVHPKYGSGHLVMAKISLDKGLYDWAESEVQKAIELDGSTRATELLLSEIYIYKAEFNKACRLLEKLLQDDPENEQIKKLLDIARKIPMDANQDAVPNQVGVSAMSSSAVVTVVPAVSPSTAVEAESVESTTPSNITFKQLMKILVVTPGVEGVLVIGKEGLVIESDWNVAGNTDLMSALAAETARYAATQMKENNFGELQSVLLETGNALVYLSYARQKLLAIVCTDKINLGSLKFKLASLVPRLVD